MQLGRAIYPPQIDVSRSSPEWLKLAFGGRDRSLQLFVLLIARRTVNRQPCMIFKHLKAVPV